MTRNQVLALFDGGLPSPPMRSKKDMKRAWYLKNRERVLAVNAAYREKKRNARNA